MTDLATTVAAANRVLLGSDEVGVFDDHGTHTCVYTAPNGSPVCGVGRILDALNLERPAWDDEEGANNNPVDLFLDDAHPGVFSEGALGFLVLLQAVNDETGAKRTLGWVYEAAVFAWFLGLGPLELRSCLVVASRT